MLREPQKSVEETVREYQKFASQFMLPPIDIVLACRGDEIIPPPLLPSKGVIEVRRTVVPMLVYKDQVYPYIFPTDFVGASGIVQEKTVTSVRELARVGKD